MKLSNFDLQYSEQYKKLTEETSEKSTEEFEYICPNCGSIHVYKGRFFVVPSENEKSEDSPNEKMSDAWFCKNCEFIWTDGYTHTKYNFSSIKNDFTK